MMNDSIAGTNTGTTFPLRLAFTRRRQVPGCYFWQSLLRSILNKLSATSGIAYIHLSISHHFAICSHKVDTELVVDVGTQISFGYRLENFLRATWKAIDLSVHFNPPRYLFSVPLRCSLLLFRWLPSSASAGSGWISPGVMTRRRYSCAGT
jgi:hypothetical protein